MITMRPYRLTKDETEPIMIQEQHKRNIHNSDLLRRALLLALAGLGREKRGVNVWHDTALADDNITEQLVQPTCHESDEGRQ